MMMHTVTGGLQRMKTYRISFTRIEDDAGLSLELISHYTCIYGKDSGEGKTEFISLVEEGMNDGSIRIDSPIPFAIGSPGNTGALLLNENRQIIMIDESVVLRDELIRQINESRHLFICISRAMPLKNSYPLDGIYLLSRTEDGWFAVEHDGCAICTCFYRPWKYRERIRAATEKDYTESSNQIL